MSDAGLDGLDDLIAMQQTLHHLSSPTRLLAASIRQLSQLTILARRGLDTFTLTPALVDALLENGLTNQAAADFEEKAAASQ
jgi:transaldolase